MTTEPDIVKQDYLNKWMTDANTNKPGWQAMYFVLHGTSNRNAARLDWYESQEQFLQSPGMRKALYIEEIMKCEQIPFTEETSKIYGSSAKHLLAIYTYRLKIANYVLKCSTEELLKEWLSHLTELLKRVRTLSKNIRATIFEKPDQSDIYNPNVYASSSYDVEVGDTAAAIHCELQGQYRILLSQQHITLADPATNSPVITWMYKYIRRFGYSEKSLTIEGGSKCGIGQGLFIFKTDRGNQLMDAINERIKQLHSQGEDEYSYISFSDVAGKPPGKSLQHSTTPDGRKVESNNNQIQEKPPLMQKPAPAAAKSNGAIPSSDQPQQPQPKMSEVLMQMPQKSLPAKEDEVYGYSHLDLKGTVSKASSSTTAEDENPYGEQLIKNLKDSK